MKLSSFLYFLLCGSVFGLVILFLEIRVISEIPLEREATSASKLFLSGVTWYLGLHLIMSLLIVVVYLAASKIFEVVNKRVIPNPLLSVWGLSLLLFLDLLLFFIPVFGERLFRDSFYSQGWMLMIFLGILSLMSLVPCILISIFLRDLYKLASALQLLLISGISFTAITWLHQKNIVVTEGAPLTTHIFNLNTLLWLLEGILCGGLALILIFIVSRIIKRFRSLYLPNPKFLPLSFLVFLAVLLWIGVLISKPDMVAQANIVSPVAMHRTDSPNVIVIVVDTLGGKYLDSTKLKQYPGFLQLAQDGFCFDNAYSTAGITAWSMPAILTSNFDFANSGTQFKNFGWLDDKEITIAEILSGEGYETIGFSSNPIISKTLNYDQGFDYFSEPYITRLLVFNLLKSFSEMNPRFAYQYGLVDAGIYYEGIKELYSKLANYLSSNHSHPFYLYVQTMDMHGPYLPPKEYVDDRFTFEKFLPYSTLLRQKYDGTIHQVPDDVRDNLLRLYLGELQYTDKYIGQLIQLLKKLGLYDNTLIIVTSDHGEEFWEHGSVIHGHTLYNELIRVPLFIKPPVSSIRNAHFPKGLTVKAVVSTLDILPTILEFTGVKPGSSEKYIKGESLVHLMSGKADKTGNTFLYGVMRNLYYVIDGEWKLIWNRGSHAFELYNLQEDPLEKKNLFSPNHPMAQKLLPTLNSFANNFQSTKENNRSRELPLQLKEQLRGLGYVE